MTSLTVVSDNPQSTAAEYYAAVAAMRLQDLIAKALESYSTRPKEQRAMLPSAWIANRLVVEVPGIIEAVQAGGRE